MDNRFKIFGVPFDPANSPERLSLKNASILHQSDEPDASIPILDPYDIVKSHFSPHFFGDNTWMGKLQVDSWLTPRPKKSDLLLLTPERCDEFLGENVCWDYALKAADFVEKKIFPFIPVMIGVDHSTTGGLLYSLTKKYENINVIILDAHFDVMRFSQSAFNPSKEPASFYQCGNFLDYVLDKKLIRPENVWVLGVDGLAFQENSSNQMNSLSRRNLEGAKRWISSGVNVLFKEDIIKGNLNLKLSGPTYLSIDMDIGSLSSIFSARYMTCYGLSVNEFHDLLSYVDSCIKKSNVSLIGIDIMEMDIHLLDIVDSLNIKDYTKDIIENIFNLFVKE